MPKKTRRTPKRYPTVALHPGAQARARGPAPSRRAFNPPPLRKTDPEPEVCQGAGYGPPIDAGRTAGHDRSAPHARPGDEPTYGRWQRLRWLLKAGREMLDLYCKNLFGRWK